MKKFVRFGYHNIELELPVHGLYLFRNRGELISNVSPLIREGINDGEKCYFFGTKKLGEEISKRLSDATKKSPNSLTVAKKVPATERLVSWLKTEVRKVMVEGFRALRVFVLIKKPVEEPYEMLLDDFLSDPRIPLVFICLYPAKKLNSLEVMDVLKLHPFVFVEHLLQPNTFYSRIRHSIWLDSLTGVFNRRYLNNQLSRELKRCSRYRRHLSLIMVDIDKFKKFNDTYGHLKGDELLKAISKLLEENTRGVDFVARYGGDEFLLVLPETKKKDAKILADRIRTMVYQYDFLPGTPAIEETTISAGISGFPDDGGDVETLLNCADVALYRCKELGGNRVESYGS
ncbi:MAG TPA: diguanylate cyclase [bacterium (Candidatus Stahlbacteria)]|nr:diguanylate cyclase [Candidatus Stahlbacteria bacterium]